MRSRLAVLLLLLATTAHATPALLSSFDVVDDATTTAIDTVDLVEFLGGGASDADVRANLCTANSYRCHNDNNGGDSSSYWAGWIDLASGERGGWEQPTYVALPANTTSGVVAFALHWPSGGGVSGDREIARWTMGAGGTQGCNVRLTSSRTMKLYYASTLIGTTASAVLQTNACSDDPLKQCTAGSDCVSNSCTTCNTSTGAGCYWPTVELVQDNFFTSTGDQVVCSLWVNGVRQLTSGFTSAAGLGYLTGFEIGGPGTESATAQLAFDDVVVATGDTRAGKGYLHWMTPNAMVVAGATESSCGTGTQYVRCVNDFASGGQLTTTAVNDTLRVQAVGRTASVTEFTPKLSNSVPTGAQIPAVALPVVARTASGSTASTSAAVANCSSAAAACDKVATPVVVAHGEVSSGFVLTAEPVATVPPAGGGAWSPSTLGTLGLVWGTASTGTARLGAAGAVVYVRREDTPPVLTLKDHNLGTDDGAKTAYMIGDSLCTGVGAASCVGGTAPPNTICSQDTYCSWDNVNKAKPLGGCVEGGHECESCANRRTEFANGAGYPCGANNGGASCNLGTCSVNTTCGLGTGTCSGDADITCSCNGDCDLGACATTATCEDACPGTGGTCPTRGGVPNYMRFTADNFYNCGRDASTSKVWEPLFLQALYGRAENCRQVWGSAGKCTCSSNSECQASSGGTCTKSSGNGRCSSSVWTTCTVDGDCPGGETCLGVCTASDNGRDACTGPNVVGSNPVINQCATNRVCSFPLPDYIANMVWVNDLANGGWQDAQCRWPYTVGWDCDNCTETTCISDSECSSISASSRCLGTDGDTASGATGCFGLSFDYPQRANCSTYTRPCRTSAECTNGQSCTGASGGTQRDGICTCANSGQCPTNYSCEGSICRKTCASGCGTGGSCDTTPATDVCKGRCTCPCDSISCSVDADCPAGNEGWTKNLPAVYPARKLSGKCVAGKCDNCAGSNCASADSFGYTHNYSRFTTGAYWGRVHRTNVATIATEAARTSDSTKPLLIPIISDDATSRYNPSCDGQFWGDAQNASMSAQAQLRSEFPFVCSARRYIQDMPDATSYADAVHPNPIGGDAMARSIAECWETFGACRTGTKDLSVLARYCKNPDGTWHSPDTTCTVDTDCSGSDSCAKRPCTVDDDTASGCPGTPTCNLE